MSLIKLTIIEMNVINMKNLAEEIIPSWWGLDSIRGQFNWL